MPILRTYRFALSITLLLALWLGALLWGGLGLGLDRSLYLALYAGGEPALLGVSRVLSMLGRYYVLIPLAVAAAVYLAFKRRRRAALLLVIVFGCRLLVELQKSLFARPRRKVLKPKPRPPAIRAMPRMIPAASSKPSP